MIIENSFKNSVDKNISLEFSDFYQFVLFKKTLFTSEALKILLKGCKDKNLHLELKKH